MWQMGGLGPMMGQLYHFQKSAPDKQKYSLGRYTDETHRLLGVLNTQLTKTRAFVSGRQYTVCDMAVFPWCRTCDTLGIELANYPEVKRWFDAVNGRPAVKRALDVLVEYRRKNT